MSKPRKYPIISVYGPTVNGEGYFVGTPTYVIVLAGCDYRCSWCNMIDAVDSEQIKRNVTQLTPQQIKRELRRLKPGARWVTLTGGNPALLDCGPLIDTLQDEGVLVEVETQGSKWNYWLRYANHVTVSPKPPSSNMNTDWAVLETVVTNLQEFDVSHHLKITVFNENDYDYAKQVHAQFGTYQPLYLTVGNHQPYGEFDIEGVLDTYAWLAERVATDTDWTTPVIVTPQLQTLIYGNTIPR